MSSDASGVVAVRWPCRQCGYVLLGLPLNDPCPECARPVAWSMQPELFRFSSPNYLAKLHRGALVASLAIVVQLVVRTAELALRLT